MIYTSNYRSYNKVKVMYGHKFRLLSISRGEPGNIKLPRYEPLTPSWKLVNMRDNWGEYIKAFNSEVLDVLDVGDVVNSLGDAVLFCYCTHQNCHRHLVADWIKKNTGIEVKDITL